MADQHLYDRDGKLFTPTQWAGSPWSKSHQHGAPVNALFASAAIEAADEAGLRLARLTVDLFRAVPLIPLELDWEFAHRGRRIANVVATLTDPTSGDRISQASAVLLKDEAHVERTWDQSPPPPLPKDQARDVEFMPTALGQTFPPGFHRSVRIELGADTHGPAAWMNSPLDWHPGVPMSPWQSSAAVADLTFGLSGRSLIEQGQQPLAVRRVPLINVDTTIYWEREPVGDWFGFRHPLLCAERGTGLAEIDLADSHGRFGRGLQTLLANPAPPAP